MDTAEIIGRSIFMFDVTILIIIDRKMDAATDVKRQIRWYLLSQRKELLDSQWFLDKNQHRQSWLSLDYQVILLFLSKKV